MNCVYCNYSTDKAFSWDSHISSGEHRRNKTAADREKLLEALKYVYRALEPIQNGERGGAVMGFASLARDVAGEAIAEVEAE